MPKHVYFWDNTTLVFLTFYLSNFAKTFQQFFFSRFDATLNLNLFETKSRKINLHDIFFVICLLRRNEGVFILNHCTNIYSKNFQRTSKIMSCEVVFCSHLVWFPCKIYEIWLAFLIVCIILVADKEWIVHTKTLGRFGGNEHVNISSRLLLTKVFCAFFIFWLRYTFYKSNKTLFPRICSVITPLWCFRFQICP